MVDRLTFHLHSIRKDAHAPLHMSLIIIGEAARKVMDGHAGFAQVHAEVPWSYMRGMRNRMAHGYFDINLDVVWNPIQTALPALLELLPAVQRDAGDRVE